MLRTAKSRAILALTVIGGGTVAGMEALYLSSGHPWWLAPVTMLGSVALIGVFCAIADWIKRGS